MDLYNGRFVRYDMARRRIVIYSFVRSFVRSSTDFARPSLLAKCQSQLSHPRYIGPMCLCVHNIRSFIFLFCFHSFHCDLQSFIVSCIARLQNIHQHTLPSSVVKIYVYGHIHHIICNLIRAKEVKKAKFSTDTIMTA